MEKKERIKSLFEDFSKALNKLERVYEEDGHDEIVRDAAIKRFEFTLELAWKLLQIIAQDKGIRILGSRDAIRFGIQAELISNSEKWFECIDGRNMTVHEYGLKKAEIVYPLGKDLILLGKELKDKVDLSYIK
jgi:nucleotidyltransferase substrate binding protein (TIGR01987 family)